MSQIAEQKKQQALQLAVEHGEIDHGIRSIFRVLAPEPAEEIPSEPVKLLEVNRNAIKGGIVPVYFRPDPLTGIVFPTLIMEVTPSECDEIRCGLLPLPHSWALSNEDLLTVALSP